MAKKDDRRTIGEMVIAAFNGGRQQMTPGEQILATGPTRSLAGPRLAEAAPNPTMYDPGFRPVYVPAGVVYTLGTRFVNPKTDAGMLVFSAMWAGQLSDMLKFTTDDVLTTGWALRAQTPDPQTGLLTQEVELAFPLVPQSGPDDQEGNTELDRIAMVPAIFLSINRGNQVAPATLKFTLEWVSEDRRARSQSFQIAVGQYDTNQVILPLTAIVNSAPVPSAAIVHNNINIGGETITLTSIPGGVTTSSDLPRGFRLSEQSIRLTVTGPAGYSGEFEGITYASDWMPKLFTDFQWTEMPTWRAINERVERGGQ